jgi:hypothetical protein
VYQVLELADVARPRVRVERPQGFWMQALAGRVVALRALPE